MRTTLADRLSYGVMFWLLLSGGAAILASVAGLIGYDACHFVPPAVVVCAGLAALITWGAD